MCLTQKSHARLARVQSLYTLNICSPNVTCHSLLPSVITVIPRVTSSTDFASKGCIPGDLQMPIKTTVSSHIVVEVCKFMHWYFHKFLHLYIYSRPMKYSNIFSSKQRNVGLQIWQFLINQISCTKFKHWKCEHIMCAKCSIFMAGWSLSILRTASYFDLIEFWWLNNFHCSGQYRSALCKVAF